MMSLSEIRENNCYICLDEKLIHVEKKDGQTWKAVESDAISSRCGHGVHIDCIRDFFEKQNSHAPSQCPSCREFDWLKVEDLPRLPIAQRMIRAIKRIPSFIRSGLKSRVVTHIMIGLKGGLTCFIKHPILLCCPLVAGAMFALVPTCLKILPLIGIFNIAIFLQRSQDSEFYWGRVGFAIGGSLNFAIATIFTTSVLIYSFPSIVL